MKAVVILALSLLTGSTFAFSPSSRRYAAEKSSRSFSLLGDTMNKRNTKLFASKNQNEESLEMNRRSVVQALISSAVIFSSVQPASAAATDIQKVFTQIEQARKQLEPVPTLIQEEKWDAVRAILITPPLSDCWSKTSKLLKNYADAIGELPDGDEFAALELKDDAEYHLRFLDMAVYNNVFNPIKTEGESGATKELVRSYYEDPKNEYNACVKIFDALIDLKNGSN